ncbi:hypothetical protein D3C87_1928090 [compost metagenome]
MTSSGRAQYSTRLSSVFTTIEVQAMTVTKDGFSATYGVLPPLPITEPLMSPPAGKIGETSLYSE